MKVSSLCVGAVCLTLLVASVATAQQRPRQRGEAGPAMMGRMGGGLGLGMALLSERVQKEIGLEEGQKKQLEEFAQAQRAGFQRPEGGEDLTQEQRRERFQQMIAERTAETEKKLKEVLTEKQFERLNQVVWQLQGPAVLRNPALQARLKLTDAQKEQLEKIDTEMQEQRRELFQAGRGEEAAREQAREKMEQLGNEARKKSMAVLTADQREALPKLMGDPIDFDRSALFGPRPEGDRGQREGQRGERGQRGEGGERGQRGQRGGERAGQRGQRGGANQ